MIARANIKANDELVRLPRRSALVVTEGMANSKNMLFGDEAEAEDIFA